MRSAKSQVHPLAYELHTRAWLAELSQATGHPVTLANVPESQFRSWRELGFTHIWLMGVWQTGPTTRALAVQHWKQYWSKQEGPELLREDEIVSSPYAIRGYEVDEALGGAVGLQHFRQRLHDHGMKLLLDFIPNHVGLDHPWLTGKPELFVQGHAFFGGTFRHKTKHGMVRFAHGKDPYFPAWCDTAQLDYRKAATRNCMQEELLKVSACCDGVRCDMAMLVLSDVFERNWSRFPVHEPAVMGEFWEEAIGRVRSERPDFLFLAEAYWGLEARLQALGFDYVYNKTLYDLLVARQTSAVQEHLTQAPIEFLSRAAHFLENHDERRAAHAFLHQEHRAAALLMLCTPGLRLLHHGQLSGARHHTRVQYARFLQEAPDAQIEELYHPLLRTLHQTAVGRGRPSVLRPQPAWEGNDSHKHFVAVLWQGDSRHFELALINLAPHQAQCTLALDAGFADHDQIRMRDLIGPERHLRSRRELQKPLFFDLPGHAAQLFRFEGSLDHG